MKSSDAGKQSISVDGFIRNSHPRILNSGVQPFF